ncbi:MerR family transcriptional regulator [Alistipes sp.]|uniref:MerR family transcriptional regulator n=1 Tax=Alistipes sp. TaxID=1872444 RepID=UPI003AEFF12D
MAKKLFYSMGEVSEMFDVNASLIRHWESKFDVLRPRKNKKGNRMFSPGDVENLKLIYHLVKERGMTLEGANRCLKRNRGALTRDAELLERLQRVRAMLVEVREELRSDDDATILADEPDAASVGSDAFCEAKAVDASAADVSPYDAPAADASATDTPVADASEADIVTGGECDAKSAQESEGAEVFVRFPDGGFAVDGEAADDGGADDRSTEEAGMPEVGGFEPEENSGDDRTMSIRLSGPEALPGGCGAAAEQEEDGNGVVDGYATECAAKPGKCGVAAEQEEDGNGVVDGYATECAAKPGIGVPAAESAGTEIPFTELPLSEIPAGKQPAFGQPDGGQPTGGQPDDRLSSVALSAGDSPADVSGGEPAAEHSVPQPAVRRPRRKRDDEGDKELFAFYEQSLF